MSNDVKKNSITFYQNGNTNPENIVMSISKDGVWANPDLPTTEAADLVLKALDEAIKFMVKKAIEDEREACAKVADEHAKQVLEHNFSALIANNIRARGQK